MWTMKLGYEFNLISTLRSKYVVQTWFGMGPRLVNGNKNVYILCTVHYPYRSCAYSNYSLYENGGYNYLSLMLVLWYNCIIAHADWRPKHLHKILGKGGIGFESWLA